MNKHAKMALTVIIFLSALGMVTFFVATIHGNILVDEGYISEIELYQNYVSSTFLDLFAFSAATYLISVIYTSVGDFTFYCMVAVIAVGSNLAFSYLQLANHAYEDTINIISVFSLNLSIVVFPMIFSLIRISPKIFKTEESKE